MADTRWNVTVRLRDETVNDLNDEADCKDVTRSEHIREILERRHEVEQLTKEVERPQERLDTREERIDELEEQLARRSQLEEKVDLLAKQQDEADAPFFVRWYRWWRQRQQ
jgi:predicted nuclease with TOPRIM domain